MEDQPYQDGPAVTVLIVAAGRGRRMGDALPKQYLDLCGKPVLRRTIEGCLASPRVTSCLVVIHPADAHLYQSAIEGLDEDRLLSPAVGANTRSGSVRAGLEALSGHAPDAVLIHDAARPFVTPDLISRVVDALEKSEGAFSALPVVDALWQVEGETASHPVSRDGIWRAQTPQGFRFAPILAAYQADASDAADDVEVGKRAGLQVSIVEGEEANFKITGPADLARARALVGSRSSG